MSEPQKRLRASLAPFILEEAVEVGEIERGAYSTVVRVRWQGTEYTGKKLHDFPLRLEKKKGEEILARLKRHCELASCINHPNIVQHIGVSLSTVDAAPILVGPSLPTSVAATLKAHTRLPAPVQLSVLQDVAQGLAYLHCRQKPIFHGELNAKNVLLTRGLQAKIANLGVAAILDPSSAKVSVTLSKSPEQSSYSPPEDNTGSTAGDIFAYGVLILHIATGKWPIPVGDAKSSKELDRRKAYIDSLPDTHCLLPLIKECLQNDPGQRPLSLTLVERLTRLSSQNQIPFQTALELMITMERREGELVSMVDQLKAGQEEVEGIGKRLSTYDLQLAAVKETLKTMEEQLIGGLDGKDSRIAVSSLLQPPREVIVGIAKDKEQSQDVSNSSPVLKPTQSVFHWKRATNAPIGMHSASAIVLEGKLYIGGGETKDLLNDRILYEYDISGMVHKWTALPICPVAYFALGVVNKSLVLVGGLEIVSRKSSNKLYMWDRDRQEWSTTLPPMTTARQNPAVAAHNLSLVVAGGYKNKRVLAEVEVFDQAIFQWIQFPSLLIPTSAASCCVVRDVLYVLGGTLYGETGPSTAVQAISLTGDPTSTGWSLVKDTPLTKSYAVPSSNFVLAVGGSMPGSATPTHSIYAYFPGLDRWHYLCEMPTARTKCVAAVLSAGRLIVLGGTEEHTRTVDCGSTVELLSV